MKIAIGNDHSALEMKKEILEYVKELGHEVVNYGTDSPESCDYPLYGEKVGNAVANKEADLGILICGTGVGISLAANKVEEFVRLYAVNHILQSCQENITTAIFWHLVHAWSEASLPR